MCVCVCVCDKCVHIMFVDVSMCECNYTHLVHIIPSVVMDVVHHVSRCVDEHLVVGTTNVLHHVIVVSGGGGGVIHDILHMYSLCNSWVGTK